MDRFPDLKVCLAHGGGYTCFGVARMDIGWEADAESKASISKPPSTYLSKFLYDCLTHSEATLRFLIDSVGIERVVLGTDWPSDMGLQSPSSWIMEMDSLSQDEKEALLFRNMENLFDL